MSVDIEDVAAALVNTDALRARPVGEGRVALLTPFTFDDGDGLPIVLHHSGGLWELTDDGGTAMHLSYDDVPYETGNRGKLFQAIVAAHGLTVSDDVVSYRSAEPPAVERVLDFAHALIQLADLEFLARDSVASTFHEDVRTFLASRVSPGAISYDWHDPDRDPAGTYKADIRLVRRQGPPVLAFPINSDTRAKDATIVLSAFERWGEPVDSLVIFEDMEDLGRRTLAQLTDVAGKQFASLAGNEDRISEYLSRLGLAA